MNILITNDDGWGSGGIITLTRLMKALGKVYVLAPDSARSGMSTAISVNRNMYLKRLTKEMATSEEERDALTDTEVYVTNGNPADCIKLAIDVLFESDASKIDLVVSGINHGHNASVNLLYSGTMGACIVALEHNIRAIGWSIDDHLPEADFSYMVPYILDTTKHLIETGFKQPICYNINAPKGEIKGIQWTRQCAGHWQKEIAEEKDENGQLCYRLVGEFVNHEPEANDTDMWAMAHGYLSIQPVMLDMTAYAAL